MLALVLATVPVRPGQKPKIRFRIMYDVYEDEYFNRLANEFEQLHPEIDVVIERVTGGSWTDFEISLLNDYWNGTPPDVARINDGWLSRFIGADMLDPAPEDIAAYLDTQPVSENLKDALKKDGKSYGVIHGATWQALFYNKDHFREVGLDPEKPPQNWDELLECAKKLTVYDEKGNIVRAGLSLRKSGYAPGTAMKFFDYYFSAGGHIFDESRTHCLMNSDAGVRTLQLFLDCLYKYKVDGYEVVGDTDGFVNGTVSMFYRDPWVIKYFHDNAPDLDYGVANICTDKISSSNGGFYPFVVATGSRHKELAWDFIRYIVRPENMAQYARNEMQAPYDATAAKLPEFAENKNFSVFLQQKNVRVFPSVPHQNEISDLIGQTVERVSRTNEDPKAALDKLVAKVNPLLAVTEKKESVSPKLISGFVLGILLLGYIGFVLAWWKRDPSGRNGFLLILPMLVYFSIFFIYPIVSSLTLSFWDYNPLEPVNPFIGFGNYLACLKDQAFLKAFGNTVVYSFWTVILGTALSLFLAIILNRALEAVGLYRTLYFIPVVTSIMGAVLVWKYLYQPDAVGLFNMMLGKFGIGPILWLQNEKMALGCLIAMAIWKNMGFNMIIFLAGLKAIPEMYYEAASIDGAGEWQKFRYITLPSLKPTILFVVVTSLIATFQVFTQVVGMTEGGPNNATRTIVYHIYEIGFKDFRLGYASAAAVFMLIVVGIITWIQMRIARD
ncbi:MAG: extracellular solute-binding protein [bacterium]